MIDLTPLDLTPAQREAIEAILADSDARADEAYHQLCDARAQLAAQRYGARDAAVAARLVDAGGDLDAQFEALRRASPYLFEAQVTRSGGAQYMVRPPDGKPDMNSVLRGR